jgi:WD40 repeat protein
MAISPDGENLAAEVRVNLYDYTIAVNGRPWEKTFGCVWEPVFNPRSGGVVAPVRLEGTWTLAEDGHPIWDQRFVQVWHQKFSPDGSKLAAIVAPKYGKWTVAVDGQPWPVTFNDLVTDLQFSPNGNHVAALTKDGEKWSVVKDGKAWKSAFDMAWKPVFSPDGKHLAARVEKKSKFTIAVNDRLWSNSCEAAWDPVFSPEGDKILLRTVEDGIYHRRVIPLSELIG